MEVPSGLTWSLRKIWSGREDLVATGCAQYVFNGKYSIKNMYKCLKGESQKVEWKRLICNNSASPKSVFVLWLAIQNRLPTRDRLLSWHMDIDGTFTLCNQVDESVDHLFFNCDYASAVWDAVIQKVGHGETRPPFTEEITRAAKKSRKGKTKNKVFSLAFTETVYQIWLQRNQRIFTSKADPATTVVNRILFIAACRCTDEMSEQLL
ncbi:uncharacterized protein [Spinacia oleracea]|uniref:Reverse transcriptase zinc-binding domain-containing protein n=1 Tax=Spinacia oleracea TaxID=3562 RepID=A0A9R0IZ74_SPIOL|nr:uncharacterized protein LOC110797502 [Spinacia oleracea]